jgi:hypothetical protein
MAIRNDELQITQTCAEKERADKLSAHYFLY